jgi:hypothetical protein
VWERAVEIAQGKRREWRVIEGVSETDRLRLLVGSPARLPWAEIARRLDRSEIDVYGRFYGR